MTVHAKERYCVIKVDCSVGDARVEVERCARFFMGLLGAAEADVEFLPECWNRPYGIVRVSNRMVSRFKASLAFSSLVFDVPYTTGMIKKAKTFIKSGKE